MGPRIGDLLEARISAGRGANVGVLQSGEIWIYLFYDNHEQFMKYHIYTYINGTYKLVVERSAAHYDTATIY